MLIPKRPHHSRAAPPAVTVVHVTLLDAPPVGLDAAYDALADAI